MPDEGGLGLVDDQLTVPHDVAEWSVPAHPKPSLAGSKELVSDPFSGELAFVLRKAQNHVQVQPAHAKSPC